MCKYIPVQSQTSQIKLDFQSLSELDLNCSISSHQAQQLSNHKDKPHHLSIFPPQPRHLYSLGDYKPGHNLGLMHNTATGMLTNANHPTTASPPPMERHFSPLSLLSLAELGARWEESEEAVASTTCSSTRLASSWRAREWCICCFLVLLQIKRQVGKRWAEPKRFPHPPSTAQK